MRYLKLFIGTVITVLTLCAYAKSLNTRATTWRAFQIHRCHTKYQIKGNFIQRYFRDIEILSDEQRNLTDRIETYGLFVVAIEEMQVFEGCVRDVLNKKIDEVSEHLEKHEGKPQYITQVEMDLLYCYSDYLDDANAINWIHNGANPKDLFKAYDGVGVSQDEVVKKLTSIQEKVKKNGPYPVFKDTYTNYQACLEVIYDKYLDDEEALMKPANRF